MTQPGTRGWIDVSVIVRHGMPHRPDNPPIVLERAILRPLGGHQPGPAAPAEAAP